MERLFVKEIYRMAKKLIHKQLCVIVLLGLSAVLLSQSVQAAITPEITEIGKGIWRLRFGTPEQFTPETMRERTAELEALKQLPNGGKLPFKLEDIRCRITSGRTVVYAPFGGKHEQI